MKRRTHCCRAAGRGRARGGEWRKRSKTPRFAGPAAKGKLSKVTWPGGNSRTFIYDGKGRPSTETTTLSGTAYTLTTTYDANSRVDTLTYPSGFSVRNNYNVNGYLSSVTKTSTGFAYWNAPAYTAAGQVSTFTLGNNLTTVNQYDPATGLITGISTGVGTGSATQYLTYNYDSLGNLKQRQDGNQKLTETFAYDNLNRLQQYDVNANGTLGTNQLVSYDSIGNILSKTGVGRYTYSTAHAVLTTGNAATGAYYTYDANGNQLTGRNGRSISYTSFNQPRSITQGGKTNSFVYDGDHQRVMETTSDGTTITIHPRIDLGAHYEQVRKTNGSVEYKNYIYAGKDVIALYTTRSTGVNDTRYFHKDHLGSIDTITNESGQVVERLSYDAWGKRRNGNWTNATTAITSITHHGFTSHEHLDDVGLINMNGRIYDPTIARFLSADPTVQSPGNPQTLNRYTYAGNNPLSVTDPSGYFSWRKFFGYATFGIFGGNSSTVRNIETGFACATGIPWLCGAATAANAYASGASVEQSLKAGAIAGTTAEIFNQVGDYGHAQGWAEGSTNMIIAHSIAGGVTSVLQGGKFGPGALSAGFSEFAGPRSGDWGDFEVVKRSVLGGTASVMGGGKFANGAITAAFAYVYNDRQHQGMGVTDAQRQLAADGNVRGFWESRAAMGDPIAANALGSLDPSGGVYDYLFGGTSINNRLQAFARVYTGSELNINQVRIDLMNAHIGAVDADMRGVIGLLNPQQIAAYHQQVFATYGLPPTAFGGTPFTGSLGEADVTRGIWCRGCDWK